MSTSFTTLEEKLPNESFSKFIDDEDGVNVQSSLLLTLGFLQPSLCCMYDACDDPLDYNIKTFGGLDGFNKSYIYSFQTSDMDNFLVSPTISFDKFIDNDEIFNVQDNPKKWRSTCCNNSLYPSTFGKLYDEVSQVNSDTASTVTCSNSRESESQISLSSSSQYSNMTCDESSKDTHSQSNKASTKFSSISLQHQSIPKPSLFLDSDIFHNKCQLSISDLSSDHIVQSDRFPKYKKIRSLSVSKETSVSGNVSTVKPESDLTNAYPSSKIYFLNEKNTVVYNSSVTKNINNFMRTDILISSTLDSSETTSNCINLEVDTSSSFNENKKKDHSQELETSLRDVSNSKNRDNMFTILTNEPSNNFQSPSSLSKKKKSNRRPNSSVYDLENSIDSDKKVKYNDETSNYISVSKELSLTNNNAYSHASIDAKSISGMFNSRNANLKNVKCNDWISHEYKNNLETNSASIPLNNNLNDYKPYEELRIHKSYTECNYSGSLNHSESTFSHSNDCNDCNNVLCKVDFNKSYGTPTISNSVKIVPYVLGKQTANVDSHRTFDNDSYQHNELKLMSSHLSSSTVNCVNTSDNPQDDCITTKYQSSAISLENPSLINSNIENKIRGHMNLNLSNNSSTDALKRFKTNSLRELNPSSSINTRTNMSSNNSSVACNDFISKESIEVNLCHSPSDDKHSSIQSNQVSFKPLSLPLKNSFTNGVFNTLANKNSNDILKCQSLETRQIVNIKGCSNNIPESNHILYNSSNSNTQTIDYFYTGKLDCFNQHVVQHASLSEIYTNTEQSKTLTTEADCQEVEKGYNSKSENSLPSQRLNTNMNNDNSIVETTRSVYSDNLFTNIDNSALMYGKQFINDNSDYLNLYSNTTNPLVVNYNNIKSKSNLNNKNSSSIDEIKILQMKENSTSIENRFSDIEENDNSTSLTVYVNQVPINDSGAISNNRTDLDLSLSNNYCKSSEPSEIQSVSNIKNTVPSYDYNMQSKFDFSPLTCHLNQIHSKEPTVSLGTEVMTNYCSTDKCGPILNITHSNNNTGNPNSFDFNGKYITADESSSSESTVSTKNIMDFNSTKNGPIINCCSILNCNEKTINPTIENPTTTLKSNGSHTENTVKFQGICKQMVDDDDVVIKGSSSDVPKKNTSIRNDVKKAEDSFGFIEINPPSLENNSHSENVDNRLLLFMKQIANYDNNNNNQNRMAYSSNPMNYHSGTNTDPILSNQYQVTNNSNKHTFSNNVIQGVPNLQNQFLLNMASHLSNIQFNPYFQDSKICYPKVQEPLFFNQKQYPYSVFPYFSSDQNVENKRLTFPLLNVPINNFQPFYPFYKVDQSVSMSQKQPTTYVPAVSGSRPVSYDNDTTYLKNNNLQFNILNINNMMNNQMN